MKNINLFKKSKRCIYFSLATFLFSFISPLTYAAIHNISSLPATLNFSGSGSNWNFTDTVLLSGNLSSSSDGLIVTGHHIVILLEDNILTFNTGNGDNNRGIYFESSAHDIKVVGGLIRYGGGYSGEDNTCIWIQSCENLYFKDVDMYAAGTDGRCVGTGTSATPYLAYNLEFDGGYWEAKADSFHSGYNYDASGALIYPRRVESPNFGVKIHDITFEGVMQFVVVNGNRGGINQRYNWARGIYIHDNVIVSDAQNGTSTGDHYKTRNNYAILLYRCHEDVRIYNNNIQAGTTWGGCRGILLDETWGTDNNLNEIHNNNIEVWNGPIPDEAASSAGNCFGIRFRFGADRLKIYNNTIVVKTDLNSSTRHIGKRATGISMGMIDEENLGVLPDSVIVENNKVTALTQASGVDCYAIAIQNYLEKSGDSLKGIIIRNNKWLGNAKVLGIGGSASGARGLRLEGDTIVKLNDDYGIFDAISVGGFRNDDADDNSVDDTLIDYTFLGGASCEDIYFENSNYSNIRLMQTVKINVTESGSSNPIQDANIEIISKHSSNTISVENKATNAEGESEAFLSYYWEQDPGNDSTEFNFEINSTYNSETISKLYNFNELFGNDTTLSNDSSWKLVLVFGDGLAIDTISPGKSTIFVEP